MPVFLTRIEFWLFISIMGFGLLASWLYVCMLWPKSPSSHHKSEIDK